MTSPYQKRMSIKKAEQFLRDHPDVDAFRFWTHQRKLHERAAEKAFKLAVVFLSISLLVQLILILTEALS